MTVAQVIYSDLFYSPAQIQLVGSSHAPACYKMTYQGTVSTLGTLMCPFFLSPSPSLVLLLPAVDGGDVKVDRWGWQADNRLLSVCYCAVYIPCAPCPPPLHVALFRVYLKLHPFLTDIVHTMYLFFLGKKNQNKNFLPQIALSKKFSGPPLSPHSPSLHSFTQCHYGPTLTEAFIKCQLYTRDHTVEGQDTMIPDPKRSTCLWAFSFCWRTACRF